jgi:hypothetical protein
MLLLEFCHMSPHVVPWCPIRYNVTVTGLNFGTPSFFALTGAVLVEDDVAIGGSTVVATVQQMDQTFITFTMPAYVPT